MFRAKDIGKHPRTRNGLTDATTDGETLPGWWETCPDANVGIRTGRGVAWSLGEITRRGLPEAQIPPSRRDLRGSGVGLQPRSSLTRAR